MWKSIDAGSTWDLVTRNEDVNGIFALEIDFQNPDIVYFESKGKLYKTTDGGANWNTIGDAAFIALNHSVKDIVMHPSNNQLIWLTSDNGFYKSIDAGDNWTQIMAGDFQEIEINPANPSMVYTIKQINNKTEFYKSIDAGDNFVLKINGWPDPAASDEQKRVEIAVTPANSDYIYANATGEANGGSGTYGIYFSDDMGESWSFRCCGSQPSGPASASNQNFMAWAKDGTEDGGQYYYDVALAVDPLDADKIYLGGVNHWISIDGGYNFTCPSSWAEPHLQTYVHADIHDIRFFGTELWIACDGGIFKSSDGGATIEKSMYGIAGTDFWGFGSSNQSEVMLGGVYHNGTLLKDNNTYIDDWICTGGGDGVRGFVNPGDDRVAYDDWEGRILSGDRTTEIQSFQFDSLPNASYIVGESSTMAFDPRNYNTIYLGRGNNLIKTANNGQTYSLVNDFGKKVTKVELSRINPDIIYVVLYESWWGEKQIWKSINAGADWTEVTPPSSLLGGEEWVPWDITLSSNDENILWAARTSQYSDYPNLNGKMIFKSIDAGANWTHYSTSTLDFESITNIIHQHGTDGGLYIGTRRAVYYRNNSLSDWQLFNNNLPLSTNSIKLALSYSRDKLINATNRSVYEVEMYEQSVPQAQISSDINLTSCSDSIVQFIDNSILSSNNPVWQWNFPGGHPNSSSIQNPVVSYSTPGVYDVSLTVIDDFGSSSQNYTAFIEYNDNTFDLDFLEDFELGLDNKWSQYNADNSYSWNEVNLINGPECSSTNCVMLDHYNIDASGDEAELILSSANLTNINSAYLYYDYAYAKWGGTNEDGFRIDISTDCGNTWDMLFEAFGDALETVDDQNSAWEPSNCSDWSTNNEIDISSYIGHSAKIRFVGINGFGNNFYLDNINILTNTEVLSKSIKESVKIYPNPSQGILIIEQPFKKCQLQISTLEGKIVKQIMLNKSKVQLDLNLPSGIYSLTINNGESMVHKKLVVL